MIDNLVSLLAAASVALAVFGTGRAGLRLLVRRAIAGPEGVAWSIGLGLVAWGAALASLAAMGLLRCEVLAPLTLLAAIWGLWKVFCAVAPVEPHALWLGVRSPPRASPLATRPSQLRPIVPLACGLAVAAATMIAALAPPISASALVGPVERSKTLLLNHGFALSTAQSGAHTSLGDLLMAWPTALDGVVAAGIVQWMLGLALALAVWALASPIAGPRAANVSGAVVLLQPQTWRSMTEPAQGLVFAICTTLALAAMWRAATDARPGRWIVLSAIMAAALLAIEPLAAVTLVALAGAAAEAMVLWPKQHAEPASPARIATGRPALFASCVVVAIACGALFALCYCQGGSAAEAMLAHLGPLPLVVLPVVLLCRMTPDARLAQLALAGLCCCGLFATGLWWAVAPLAAVAAGWLWTQLDAERAWPCRAAVGLISALAIASSLPAIISTADDVPVALGLESREQYLARRLDGYRETMLAGLLVAPEGELISHHPARAYAACRTAAPSVAAVASSERPGRQKSSGRVSRAPGSVAR